MANDISIGGLFAELGLRADSFDAGLKKAQGSLKNFSDNFSSVGRSLSVSVTAPIVGAGVAAIKMAADFETAMLEVRKVTDVDVAEGIRESVEEMAKRIPLTQEALAGLAADAARFGIRGVENISAFTEAVAKMAEATDLSEQTAGVALAKISQQTRISAKEVENLGSAINELGNNFATSESEIVDAMLRSSAAAANFGLAANEIAALNAQMNSMSESAERAGTRFRTLVEQLLDPGKLKDIAAAIGLTAQQFEEIRKKSPQQALMLLVEAMAAGGQEADNLRMTLESTALGALVALSQNLDDTKKALDISNKAFKDGTSLTKEFEAAVGSFNARWKLMMNQVRQAAINFGNELLPVAQDLMSVISDAAESFSKLSSSSKKSIIFLSAVAAAIPPVIVALGALSAAIAAISAPVVAVVAAVGGAVALIIAEWDKIRAYFTTGLGGRIFDRFAKRAMELFKMLSDGWNDFVNQFGGSGNVISMALEGIVVIVGIAALAIINTLNTIIALLSGEWKKAWISASKIVGDTIGIISDSVARRTKEMSKSMEDALVGPPESGYNKMMEDLFNDLTGVENQAEKVNTKLGSGGTAGILNDLRKKLEDLEEAKNAALSIDEIISFNAQIKETQKQIEELENAFKFDASGIDTVGGIAPSLDEDAMKKSLKNLPSGGNIGFNFDFQGIQMAELLGDELDVLHERARMVENSIASMTTTFGAHSPQVQAAVDQWVALRDQIDQTSLSMQAAQQASQLTQDLFGSVFTTIAETAGGAMTGFGGRLKEVKEEIAAVEEQMRTASEGAMPALRDRMRDLKMEAQVLKNPFRAMFKTILSAVANFGKQFGTLLVALGTARDSLNAIGITGVGAIVAGTALIALSTAMQGLLNKGPDLPRMAMGGIVPPGFPNDTYPALLSSGETVLPAPRPLPAMGGSGSVIENNIYLDGDLVYRNQKEVAYKKQR